MAFILHLIDAPEVTTAREAASFISAEDGKSPTSHPKFSKFVEEITEIYPDLTEDDVDAEDDANVWEEGLHDRTSCGQVKLLALKEDLADEVLIDALAQAAVRNGLKLFDSEGMVLYHD